MKKYNSGDGHDRGTASQDGRHSGQRTAALKQKKKRNRSRAHADASENRIENSLRTRLLIPTARQPKKRKVKQDRQCGRCFNNESTEPLANPIGGEFRKDLMRAVKNGRDHRIPKPNCHKTRS